MKTSSLIAVAALSVLNLTAAAWAEQSLAADQSEIKFTFKQLGVPVTGHFKTFGADVKLNPKDLAGSSVNVKVDTGSATIGVPETESELAKKPWFDTAQFPQASFSSSSIKAVGDGQYEAQGKLNIKGVSTDVTVPVKLQQTNGATIATGEIPLQRLNFKIGEGEWSDTSMVADEVKVTFKLAINGVDPL
ncbi:YceI family protein [Lampropedia puyangensis]|uniref:YceI family protein n=1 Tax=Lampropedia puyangensis TaxID=1330072 RepID=A0A4S8FA02_9BURK|nr:YceI family protein [Lampropedia puyangensis]THU04413.1 YceI family protein [Lampropedia puyangensis]